MNKGTVVVKTIESEVLKNNKPNDPAARELYVYLPPDYENDSTKHYPTVYVLTGFTGRGKMLLNDQAFTPTLAARMDRLIAENKTQPMIVVMPDCFTYYGGSQYINSTATGRYEDYLIDEIVPHVDANFRTVAERDSRAVVGKSSGGYGALIHAMRHADTFGLAASHSGDSYFDYCYLPDFPKAFRAIKGDVKKFLDKFWGEEKKRKGDFDAFNMIGMSACYSPDENAPLGFRLPFDLQTGEIIQEIFEKWYEHDPVRLVEKHADALKSLKLLFIDAGTRDEWFLDIGAKVLISKLKEHGINFIHEEFDDGHMNISYRFDRSFEEISNAVNRKSWFKGKLQMQDSISNKQPSKLKRNIILFLIATIFLIAAMFYSCIKSLPKITVSKETPIVFHASGSNAIIFFEVIGDGKLWTLYPKGRVTLHELSGVKYGEVPLSCKQAFPQDLSPPPPLIEGGRYEAFVVIFDGAPVRVKFTIKDGKTVDVISGR